MTDLEFSRVINIHKIHKHDENTYNYQASEKELADITKRLKIVNMLSLQADVKARIYKKDHVMVSGILTSQVVQESIISLAPVHEDVEAEFSLIFIMGDSPQNNNSESILNVDENLEKESMDSQGNCEIGDIIIQELSLALNPFPKTQEDQNFEVFTYGDEIPLAEEKNPFSVLKNLKNK